MQFTRLSIFTIFVTFLCITMPQFAVSDDQVTSDTAEEEAPLSLEEVDELLASLPTASDATEAALKTEVSQEYYDLYSRQVMYRENVQEFRQMLEERQQSFARPQTDALKHYRALVKKVYTAEAAAAAALEEMENSPSDQEQTSQPLASEENDQAITGSEEENVSSQDAKPSDMSTKRDDETGIKEQPISPKNGESDKNKKVVTSDSAPDFDPENLP